MFFYMWLKLVSEANCACRKSVKLGKINNFWEDATFRSDIKMNHKYRNCKYYPQGNKGAQSYSERGIQMSMRFKQKSICKLDLTKTM